MPERIPQSATIRVALRAYLSTDHLSAATGKTIPITISKNGGAFGNPSVGATNATEISGGWYYVDLSATDTGTVGPLVILGALAGIDPIETSYDVAAFSVSQTGDSYLIVKSGGTGDNAAIKTQTDKMAFTVANQIDSNVIDWKGATAPAMTGDAYARIGVGGAGLTALGDTRIANLDATVGSRSTYAGADTAGTTTLLSRLTSTRGSNLDNLDTAVSSRLATTGYTAPDNADISSLRTDLTTARAAKLDNLDTTVSSRSTYAGGNVTLATSQPNYAPSKAGDKMDLVDAPNATAISTFITAILAIATSSATGAGTLFKRLLDFVGVSSVYAASPTPPTAASIRDEIDSNSTQLQALVSGVTGLASPDNTGIAAIKSQTDKLHFTGNNVQAVAAGSDPWNVDLSVYPEGSAGYLMLEVVGKTGLIESNGFVHQPEFENELITIFRARDFNAADGLSIDIPTSVTITGVGETYQFNASALSSILIIPNSDAASTLTYFNSHTVRLNLAAVDASKLVIDNGGIWELEVIRSGRHIPANNGTLRVKKVIA